MEEANRGHWKYICLQHWLLIVSLVSNNVYMIMSSSCGVIKTPQKHGLCVQDPNDFCKARGEKRHVLSFRTDTSYLMVEGVMFSAVVYLRCIWHSLTAQLKPGLSLSGHGKRKGRVTRNMVMQKWTVMCDDRTKPLNTPMTGSRLVCRGRWTALASAVLMLCDIPRRLSQAAQLSSRRFCCLCVICLLGLPICKMWFRA